MKTAPPMSGLVVTLELVEVGSRTQPATATTDPNGAYSISYAGDTDSRDGVPGRPLQVIVSDGAEVGRSVVITDPSADQRVDVVVGSEYRGRGEYDRVQAALTPHLNGATLSNLGADDLEILAKRADVYPPHVAFAIQAARLANGTSVSESTFYALLRERLPASMAGLLSTPRAAREAALRAAYDDRVLPPPGGTVDAAVAAAMTDLDALVVDAALVAPSGGETNVRALLDTSGLAETRLRLFVEHWVANDEDEDAMWAAVGADAGLTTAMEDDLRFTVEGAALVRGFLPALTELQTQRTATTISTIEDLAAWDIAEWTTFVTTTGAPTDLPGADAAAREALYAATLNRIVESIYPTRVLGHRVARRRSSLRPRACPSSSMPIRLSTSVTTSWRRTSTRTLVRFPLGKTRRTRRRCLEIVQRLYSLTPPMHNYDTTHVLLDAGVTSALDIVTMGKTSFVDTYASALDGLHPSYTGAELANAIFTNAEFKHGATIALASTYAPQMNTVSAAAVPANFASATGDGSTQLLDIFGSLDYCACEHCRSVFSPAAYLVDLLVVLDLDRPGGSERCARRADHSPSRHPRAAAVVRQHQHRGALHRPRQRDARGSGPGQSACRPRHDVERGGAAAVSRASRHARLRRRGHCRVPLVAASACSDGGGARVPRAARYAPGGGHANAFRRATLRHPRTSVAEALGMTPFEASVVIGAGPLR